MALKFIILFSFVILFYLPNTVMGQIVKDSSFEMGSPNLHWSEQSTNFSYLICNSLCGSNPGIQPYTGSHFVWFGGSSAQPENAVLSQTINIGTSNFAQLQFYLKTPKIAPISSDYLKVFIDSILVFQFSTSDSDFYKMEYRDVNIDVSQWANNQNHVLKFVCYQSANLGVSSFLVDDVSITTSSNISTANLPIDASIYFNPLLQKIDILLNTPMDAKVFLMNNSGQIIAQSQILRSRTANFDTYFLSSGIYLIAIQSKSGIIRKKILIIN